MADWHHEQAEQARRRMREAADKLTAIDEFTTGVNDLLRGKETTGKFDREQAIRLLKSKGVYADPSEDEQSLLIKLKTEDRKAEEEKPKFSKQYDDSKVDADYHDAQEKEDRKKAEELIQKRDAIRSGGYEPQEESQQLQKVTDEYKLDVQKKATELEHRKNGLEQAKVLDANEQESFDGSKAAQTGSELSDFMASADDLTTKFGAAATTIAKEDPQPSLTLRNVTPTTGPTSSV